MTQNHDLQVDPGGMRVRYGHGTFDLTKGNQDERVFIFYDTPSRAMFFRNAKCIEKSRKDSLKMANSNYRTNMAY